MHRDPHNNLGMLGMLGHFVKEANATVLGMLLGVPHVSIPLFFISVANVGLRMLKLGLAGSLSMKLVLVGHHSFLSVPKVKQSC